jgi:hypothetical protein
LSTARVRQHYRAMEKISVPVDNCPVAPQPRITVHTRVLHRACQILGGIEQLARHLKVSLTLVHAWLEGEDVPPSSIFLKAVDLILPTWGPEDDALAKAIAATRPKAKKN